MIALTSGHTVYHPNQVAILSGDGKLLREYWHPGFFWDLAILDLDGDGTEEILLGGVNNARRTATLVVLNPNEMEGAAAEPGKPRFEFQGFPRGRERARVFFHPSCVSQLVRQWNFVWDLIVRPDSVTVTTWEGTEATAPLVHYHLNRNLQIQGVGISDDFQQVHSELRRSGRLNHDFTSKESEELKRRVTIESHP